MIYLINRQIREGGLTHTYFDISFSKDTQNLAAGFGYRLPDGRVQPSSMDGTLREWYKRVWAVFQENDLYPGAVSGHATNSICLRALPWTDAILDSEYPMLDPITVYPPDRMIALSCPESFGVTISHLGFMNPHWAAMHDANMGGDGGAFNSTGFRHFGITSDDVQFIPYWRNGSIVKHIGQGLLASIWQRPGKAVLEVLNYGLDPEGKEKQRPGELTLDLRALGIPAGISAEQVRVSELNVDNGHILPRYLGHLAWYKNLPENPRPGGPGDQYKLRPAAAPRLDAKTGALTNFDLFYHDARYLLITWDDKAGDAPAPLRAALSEADVAAAANWGINRATAVELSAPELATAVQSDAGIQTRVWKQPGTVMLYLFNPGAKPATAALTLDLDKLGVKVKKLWTNYTQCLGGALDAPTGAVTVKDIQPGKGKVVFIDTF